MATKSDENLALQNIAGAGILLIPLVILGLAILKTTDGNFTYTLDDAYIHLALAKHIFEGHYGINTGELSAPSSSLAWPFMLAPFYAIPDVFEIIPLILNAIALLITALMLLSAIQDKPVWKITAVFFALVSLNLYGLVFTGLEHSVQALLVIAIALHILNLRSDTLFAAGIRGKIALASLLLLPLIRYEGLAITLPCLAYLWSRQEKGTAILGLCITLGLLGVYSLWLSLHGLGALPLSVIAKSPPTDVSYVLSNLGSNMAHYGLVLIWVAWLVWEHGRREMRLGALIVAVCMLHFLFGKHGFYGRYEVYFLAFLLVLTIHSIQRHQLRVIHFFWILPFSFIHLVFPFISTPIAASNIRNQQGRMSEIVAMLEAPVAVNDLGIVALRSRHYVLDLAGLGSKEALDMRRSQSNPEWMHSLMQQRQVRIAMVYDEWFPKKPDSWQRVGELKLLEQRITPHSDTVVFYAIDEASKRHLRETLLSYRASQVSEKFAIQITDAF